MQIQVNTDNATEGHARLVERVETHVRDQLSRYADRLTRVEVHLTDVNGDGTGDDKRCVMEVRPSGREPLVASDEAATFDKALAGAAHKAISVLDRTFGKMTDRKGH